MIGLVSLVILDFKLFTPKSALPPDFLWVVEQIPGTMVDGDATIQEVGQEIFDKIIATVSGEKSRSEVHGFGEDEFVPWTVGAIL